MTAHLPPEKRKALGLEIAHARALGASWKALERRYDYCERHLRRLMGAADPEQMSDLFSQMSDRGRCAAAEAAPMLGADPPPRHRGD